MDQSRPRRSGDRLRQIGDDVADVAEVVGRVGARSVEAGGQLASDVLKSGATWMGAMTTGVADAAGMVLDRRADRRRRRRHSHDSREV